MSTPLSSTTWHDGAGRYYDHPPPPDMIDGRGGLGRAVRVAGGGSIDSSLTARVGRGIEVRRATPQHSNAATRGAAERDGEEARLAHASLD